MVRTSNHRAPVVVMMHWVYLAMAIVCEVVGTSALKYSDSFSKLMPSALCVVSFIAALYFMSFALKTIPVGIVYAIWSGAGIVLISIIGYLVFKQSLDTPALVGIALIIAGVVVINTLSKSVAH